LTACAGQSLASERCVRVFLRIAIVLALWVPVRLAAETGDRPVSPTGQQTSTAAAAQELKTRIERFAATLPPSQRIGPSRLADATLAVRKLELVSRSGLGWFDHDELLTKAETAVAALGHAERQEQARTGFQERAYISEIDGSAEPYLLYVPTSYHERRQWPLLIFLHGYHPQLSVLNWIDWMYSPTLQDVCEREGVILLMPYGRSNTEFMGIGESDVLCTIGYVRDEYRVDPRRIIISGASMGGSGAYSIACHQPHLFAGVMAITGRVDYYRWMKAPKNSLPRFKQVQVDTDYARELLPNLTHVPVLVFHGERDATIDIGQSQLMYERLNKLEQPCEFVKLEGMGHLGTWGMSFTHPRFIQMLRDARSPGAPRKVAFRTFTLKYPSAYWVRIDGIERWDERAEVRAEVTADGELVVKTVNVTALTLGPGIPGAGDTRKLRLLLNGSERKPEVTADGAMRIILRPPVPADGLLKTSKLCGPIREAYDGPFIIVYPAAENDSTRTDRANAQRLAREWLDFAQAEPRLRPAAEVTVEEIRDFNLILCGSGATNTVLARIAAQLPIRIERDRYLVGDRVFPSAGNGLQMIYPNPLNPHRYILVVHGAQWGPRLQPNHKLDLLPDFIVYSAETVDDGTWFPTNRFLCAGYFDANWRLAAESTWIGPARRKPVTDTGQ